MIRGGLLLFALYVMVVGWRGNAADLIDDAEQDIAGFGSWVAAWAFLMLLRATPAKPVVDPLIILALTSTILSRWNNVKTDAQTTYKIISKGN
jgi:hypothetical protein